MKKETHPKLEDVKFSCASCNAKFLLKSTISSKEYSVDVCSKCHPFYVGSSFGQQIKGRAEQFNKKIVKANPSNEKNLKENNLKQDKKIIKSLNNL